MKLKDLLLFIEDNEYDIENLHITICEEKSHNRLTRYHVIDIRNFKVSTTKGIELAFMISRKKHDTIRFDKRLMD